ncbi:RTA1 like protein-domain-containing protein [Lipomyces doorenjongii]
MDIVFHNGTNGSSPCVEFYPYTPSDSAGYAFMGLFGVSTVAHLVLTFPFRAAYFIPLILGGVCETFGYYGRAWSHQSRTEIKSWALQEMLILCAPPLVAATVYMALGRIIRSFDAEHLSSMSIKRLTLVFVLNDLLCFCTQLGGAGVQVTGDANIMNIGKKVVLAGLIFSHLAWRRYMLALYIACFALMIRNLVRTIQFGSNQTSALNIKEAFIYVFDAFMMFATIVVF